MKPSAAVEHSPLAVALDRLVADFEAIASQTTTLVEGLSTYGRLSPTELAESVRRNLNTALSALRDDAAPTLEDLSEGAARVVRRRLGQGIPVEDMMRAYRISIGHIHARFVESADGYGQYLAERRAAFLSVALPVNAETRRSFGISSW